MSESPFVLNARDANWYHREGRGAATTFEGEQEFPQVGVNLFALGRGESIGLYHWEAHQEDFLILSGEGVLIVEGEERPLRAWDFVHCPPHAKHMIVGAGDAPCVIVAIGARGPAEPWGGYVPDATAARHGVSVEAETTSAEEAYAAMPRRAPTTYDEAWLPGE